MKKVAIITIVLSLLLTLNVGNVFAGFKEVNDSATISFAIAADGGIFPATAVFVWLFYERYTPSSSSIKYTYHNVMAYCQGWTGSAYGGSLYIPPLNKVDYYDSNGNYVKSAHLWAFTGSEIIDKAWNPYVHYEGTDIATINTSSSTAKCKFTVMCYEAIYGTFSTTASLYCN